MTMRSLPDLRLDDALTAIVRELRSVLFSHGYTDAAVHTCLGAAAGAENTERLEDLWAAGRDQEVRRDRFASATDALVHLWLVEGALPLSSCVRLLGAKPATALLDAGLLSCDGDWVSARTLLVPWRGLWLLTDRYTHRNTRDAVFVPDASSYALAALLPSPIDRRRMGDSRHAVAVDVGTGCGILALAEAPLFDRVIALDVNPRAIAFARFNAAVNDRAVIVERCDRDPLHGTAPWSGVDLLTFVMPFVYGHVDDEESVALVSDEGAELLERTYRAVDRALAATGTALLWHQVRRQPPLSFERALGRWGVLTRNHILLAVAEMSDELDLGVAVVRRTTGRPAPAILRLERTERLRPAWADLERLFCGSTEEERLVKCVRG